ncbi:lipopolysaccharide biosynthesis protein [Occultella aeris]|uniref:lipopolysaccharide biosynthesis protein n=1 Tax=Occultella aeris TaxID=2761496 RepID=UPI001E539E9F|nr:lipopolysaccharide biosynthesis protein [Occultella aeris]
MQPKVDEGLERGLPSGGVGRTVTRGMSWSFLGVWSSYAIQLGTTMILARLLTPDQFGLMAMALTLTVVVNQFRNLGLSQAVVQSESLTWSQVNALFWINAVVGVVLGVAVGLSGFGLAAFYGEPDLVWVCVALGGGYVFSGLAVQHGALLNRRLQFRTLAIRNTTAGLLSCVAAVIAAFAGLGVWALVIQNLTAVLFGTLVLWLAVPWRPSRPRGFRDSFSLLKFGSNVTIANLFSTFSRQADNVIIGRFMDAGALGLYTKAYSLLTLPLRQLKTPISAVMVPTLSALQDEPERYRSTYRKTVSGLAHLGMPFVVILAVSALEVIEVFLGHQWTAAAPVFQILAIASFVQLVSTTAGWLWVSSGHTTSYARWSIAASVVTIASFILGVRWGIEGVAIAYAIGQVVMFVPAFAVATHGTPVKVADPLLAMVRPVVISTIVLGAVIGMRALAADLPPISLLTAEVATGLAVWAGAVFAWPSARREISELLTVVRRGRKSRAVPAGEEGGPDGA